MKIIPLSEGAFTIDQTKEFVPFNIEKDDLQKRAVGSLLVEIQPFVVVTKKDIIIIDCGLGFSNDNGILQIHQNLTDHGIDPLSVTKVLLSHLHKDHAGGVSKYDPILNQSFLSFPNAIHYVNEEELILSNQVNNPSYSSRKTAILNHSEKVVLLSNDGVIDDYITYKKTSAHSPNHMVFWIREDEQIVFFGGDDAPQLQQMKSKFIAKYDFNGRKCMELRAEWWKQGNIEQWVFLFYHDIKTPVYSFKQG
jgi:glyoxylase-like metal-dependent hydrolase (beta-lactamase superfamily II)